MTAICIILVSTVWFFCISLDSATDKAASSAAGENHAPQVLPRVSCSNTVPYLQCPLHRNHLMQKPNTLVTILSIIIWQTQPS